MKKLLLVAVLACSMVACGEKEVKKPVEEKQVQVCNMANPYVTCDSIEDVEKLAGFEAEEPKDLPGEVSGKILRVIPNKLIEVIYVDNQGDEVVRYRKAPGSGDISGNYSKDEDGTLKVWEANGHSYSLQYKKK